MRLFILSCVFLGATAASAAPLDVAGTPAAGRLTLALPPDPTTGVTIDVTSGGAPIGDGTTLEFYAPGATADVRTQQACRVTVTGGAIQLAAPAGNAACAELLASFFDGSLPELALGANGSTTYGLVALDLLGYQGQSASVTIATAGGVTSITISSHVTLDTADSRCFVFLEDWYQGSCARSGSDNKVSFADATVVAALQARLGGGKKATLYARVIDTGAKGVRRRLSFTGGAPGGAPPPAPPDPLHDRCTAAVPAVGSTGYHVCVDAYPTRQSIVVLECGATNDTCETAGDLVRTNRSFYVSVWTDDDIVPRISLDGTIGTSSGIYQGPPPAAAGAAPPLATPKTTWTFGPRRAGIAKLVVTGTRLDKAGTAVGEVARLEYSFTVQDRYRLAIRLGLSLSWQPWARTVGFLSTADGQRYVGITEGGEHGLIRTEVVTGFTYFVTPVQDGSLDLSLGLGLRLGLLSVATEVKPLSSIMGGVELAIGPDLAIGAYAGAARYDKPDAGFEPGRLVPAGVDRIPTHLAVTPSFAIVLNFTPGVTKSLGVSK